MIKRPALFEVAKSSTRAVAVHGKQAALLAKAHIDKVRYDPTRASAAATLMRQLAQMAQGGVSENPVLAAVGIASLTVSALNIAFGKKTGRITQALGVVATLTTVTAGFGAGGGVTIADACDAFVEHHAESHHLHHGHGDHHRHGDHRPAEAEGMEISISRMEVTAVSADLPGLSKGLESVSRELADTLREPATQANFGTANLRLLKNALKRSPQMLAAAFGFVAANSEAEVRKAQAPAAEHATRRRASIAAEPRGAALEALNDDFAFEAPTLGGS